MPWLPQIQWFHTMGISFFTVSMVMSLAMALLVPFLKVSHGCNKVLTGLHSFPGLLSALFSGFCGCGYLLVVVGLPPHFLFVLSSWRPLTSFPQGPLKGLVTTWQFTLSRPVSPQHKILWTSFRWIKPKLKKAVKSWKARVPFKGEVLNVPLLCGGSTSKVHTHRSEGLMPNFSLEINSEGTFWRLHIRALLRSDVCVSG